MKMRKLSLLICLLMVVQSIAIGCTNDSKSKKQSDDSTVISNSEQISSDGNHLEQEVSPEHSTSFFNTGESLQFEVFEQLVQESAIETEFAASTLYISPTDEILFGNEEYYSLRKTLIAKLLQEGDSAYDEALETLSHLDTLQSSFIRTVDEMYNEGPRPEFVGIMLEEQSRQVEKILMTYSEINTYSVEDEDLFVDSWMKEIKLNSQLKFADEVITYFNLLNVDVIAYLNATEGYGSTSFNERRDALNEAINITEEQEETYFSILDHINSAETYYVALEKSDYYYTVALLEEFIKYSSATTLKVNQNDNTNLSEMEIEYYLESVEMFTGLSEELLNQLLDAGSSYGYELSVNDSNSEVVNWFGLVAYADSVTDNKAYEESLKIQSVTPKKVNRKMSLIDGLTKMTESIWKVGQKVTGKVADITVASAKTIKDTGVLLTGQKSFNQYKRDFSNSAAIMTGASGNSLKIINETIDDAAEFAGNIPTKLLGKNKLTKAVGKVAKSVVKVSLVEVKTVINLVDQKTQIFDAPMVVMNSGTKVLMQELVANKKAVVSQAESIVKSVIPEKYHKAVENVSGKINDLTEKYESIKEYTDYKKILKKHISDRYVNPPVQKIKNKIEGYQEKVKDKIVDAIDTLFDQSSKVEEGVQNTSLKPITKAKESLDNKTDLVSSVQLDKSTEDKMIQWQKEHFKDFETIDKLHEKYGIKSRSTLHDENQEEIEDENPEAMEEPEEQAEPEPEMNEEEMEAGEETEVGAEQEAGEEAVESEEVETPEMEEKEVVEEETEEENIAEEEPDSNSTDMNANDSFSTQLSGNYSGYAEKIDVDGEFSSPLGQGNSRLSLNLNESGTGSMTLEIFGTGMMDMSSTLAITTPATQNGDSMSISTKDDEGDPVTVKATLSGSNLSGTIHITTGGSNIILSFTASK